LATTKARRIGVVLSPTPGAWDSKSTAAPIVWKEEERHYMLYQGWSEGSGPRILGLAESEDGLHWTKHRKNPIMKPSKGTWDQNGFECGSLLKVDSEYWLFYTGFGADGKARIGLATSETLKSWIKYERNPILDIGTSDSFESNGVAFPAVVQGTNSYKMVYGAYAPNSMQLGLATSTDGKIWRKYPNNPVFRQRGWFAEPECELWDAGIEVHQTFAVGDFYVMLYEGLGNFPHRYNLGVAYSPDCRVWARSPENPIFPLTGPNVKQDMSTVHPMLLLDEMILYYVEVIGASSLAPHRICAAKVDSDLTNPLAQRSLSYTLWEDREIDPSGAVTSAVPCMGFARRSLYLLSHKGGTVNVEIDPAGLDQWHVLHEGKASENVLWTHSTSEGFDRIRLRFLPIKRARASAWLVLGR
jgi:predicted GH43/DUF377 family glycosyl hydrolase